jgi:hypothetical protein
VKRYKEEQVQTDIFSIPNRKDMKISYVRSPIRKLTFKHYVQLAILIIISLVLGILLAIAMEKLGFHGPII